ncbi:cytochrome P450 2F2 isoform X1 [Chanos chanos]|uniref:Cytochrome P450 2F2 isoform X1 n=1 Tax=Chanos chanos TaxID=29144 RepID=A0A6J2WG59_CHACN|nr:cytochrome P450 2F2-like isoform X1 [Chanos chanos]
MLGTLVLLWLGIFILYFLVKLQRPKNFPPGPVPLPLFGNLLQFDSENPLKELDRLSRRYGSVFSVYLGGRPVVVLTGQEVIREALVTHGAEFAGRANHTMISHITAGKGLIMVDYSTRWRDHRRFTLTTLRNFGLGKQSMEERILEEAKHVCTSLEQHAGNSMNPQHLFHHAASNIICSLIFGSRFDYEDKYFQTLINSIEEFIKLMLGPWAMIYDIAPALRFLPLPFRSSFHHYELLKEHIRKVVAEHKRSQVAGEPRDLIDSYLEEMEKRAEGSSFDDANLVILLIDLFIAGTDTTSNTLRTLTLYLMTHTHIQEHCQQEIDMVLGSREHVSYEDRHAMPYVQAVIHEAQRVGDVVPLSVFHTTTANTQIRGYSIPKGTLIVPYLSSALREKDQWKFPDEFNPQNFLNDKGEFVKPDAFIPFSAGPRVCLGEGLARMELFLILVTILRRFRLVWPEDGGVPDHSLIFGMTQSARPYRLGIRSRT